MRSAFKDPVLSQYLDETRKIPTLTREEEYELATKAKAGDDDAMEALAKANLRFVVSVALRYRRYRIPVSELISEGNLGLMTAVTKFDPERGTRFVTYAGYWVRAYILDRIVRSTTMVGAGSGPLRSKLFFRLRRERARAWSLTSNLEERHNILAERLGMTPEKVEHMLHRLDVRDVSFDQPTYDDSKTSMVEQFAAKQDDQQTTFLKRERASVLEGVVSEALEYLDPREKYILEQRYMGDGHRSLASIGRDLGVSRERARQLEVRAKAKMRKRISRPKLEAVA